MNRDVGDVVVGSGKVVSCTDDGDSEGIQKREEGGPHSSVGGSLPFACKGFGGLGSEEEEVER